MRTYYILIKGIVQGVGFRPFIKNIADNIGLKGRVINSSNGVEITVYTDRITLEKFIKTIKENAPKLSIIKSIVFEEINEKLFQDFKIELTENRSGFTFISPDVATCEDCLNDIADSSNRRYNYAFTNCTNCGPRYTIIKSLPYDRKKTTMSEFIMCDDCRFEYENTADRRFHAEPIACPKCGPKVQLHYKGKVIEDSVQAIKLLSEAIDSNDIVAVKGLGGFHLITSAYSDSAIQKLRRLKARSTKPFAIMSKDISAVERVVYLTKEDREMLLSKEAPILLLKKKHGNNLSSLISPETNNFGIMLAYTPLHKIILENSKTDYILATSGNLQDEPIISDNNEALERLSYFTDIILTHNRDIFTRLDDSVITKYSEGYQVIRRSRAYAPFPIDINIKSEETIFAAGANLKSCFAIYHNGYIIVSQYLGDLDNAYTSDYYEEVYSKITKTFKMKPTVAVTDIHPDFFSTKFAKNITPNTVSVQHHVAHFLSVLAESNFTEDAVGLILDGFGLGTDNKAWGGEVFLKQGRKMIRVAHLKNYTQVGMDIATKSPYKMLISYLYSMGLLEERLPFIKKRYNLSDNDIAIIKIMIDNKINSIETSSAGRLFEAVGSLLFGKRDNEYEGALAVQLENVIDSNSEEFYYFENKEGVIDFKTVFEAIFTDMEKGIKPSDISLKFHNGFAKIMVDTASDIAERNGIKVIALSGGVFQNIYLTNKVIANIRKRGLEPMINCNLPLNDASISVGQIYYYLNKINFEEILCTMFTCFYLLS